jgi:hypothetical protein
MLSELAGLHHEASRFMNSDVTQRPGRFVCAAPRACHVHIADSMRCKHRCVHQHCVPGRRIALHAVKLESLLLAETASRTIASCAASDF